MVEQTSKKLNIVQFSSEYLGCPDSNFSYKLRGGLGVVVGDISRGLVKKGHSVRLLFPRTLDSYWEDRKDNGVEIECVKAKDSQFNGGEVGKPVVDFPESYSSKDIAKFLRDFDAFGNCALERLVNLSATSGLDVVHFHDWHFGRLAEMVSKARTEGKLNPNLKIVSTIHNGLYQGRVPLTEETCKSLGIDDKTHLSELRQKLHEGQYSFLKTLIDNSDVVVTVGKSYAEGFDKRFPGLYSKKDAIRAVPNGINFDRFNLEPVSSEEIYTKACHPKPILTFASRLIPEKGVDGIILAIKELSQLYKVHIIGECPDKFRQSLLRGMESDSVSFHGPFNRFSTLNMMEKSSVFVAPYVDEEPFGIAPIEALVKGAIPVVTDVAGLKDNFSDIEQDMKNGNAIVMRNYWRGCYTEKVLLDDLKKDIVDGAKRAYRLINDKIGCFAGAAIINNGRSQAKSGRWSIDKCVNDYLDIYQGK